MQYFHLSNGKYLKDYQGLTTLTKYKKSIYAVIDSWANYDIVRELLDKKYAKWK